MMKLELHSASNFLVHLIKLGRQSLNESQLDSFRQALIEVLRRRYRDHWFPEKPFKGSGYRCIRINGKMDPVISQAGETVGMSQQIIHSTFPSELTMWIDPLEVSYRIGENGSICVLYEFKEGVSEPWKPNSNNKSSSKGERKNKDKCNNISINNYSSGGSSSETSSTGSLTPPPMLGSSPPSSVVVPCKGSLRSMEYLLDPRKSVSIEQLTAYVAS